MQTQSVDGNILADAPKVRVGGVSYHKTRNGNERAHYNSEHDEGIVFGLTFFFGQLSGALPCRRFVLSLGDCGKNLGVLGRKY